MHDPFRWHQAGLEVSRIRNIDIITGFAAFFPISFSFVPLYIENSLTQRCNDGLHVLLLQYCCSLNLCGLLVSRYQLIKQLCCYPKLVRFGGMNPLYLFRSILISFQQCLVLIRLYIQEKQLEHMLCIFRNLALETLMLVQSANASL